MVDARFFNANNVAATAGFSHTYEAMQDLIFNFYGNYTRQTDIFNSALQFNNGAIGPPATPNVNIPIILNPFGTTPGVNPIAYNQFTGGASVTKTFDQAFVTLRGTAFDIVYDHSDNVPAPFQTSHDGASYWLSGRVGYNFPAASTCLLKAMGFFNVSTIHCSTRTDTELLGVLERTTQTVCSEVKSMADIRFQDQEAAAECASALGHPPQTPTAVSLVAVFLISRPEYWTIIASVDADIWECQRTLAPGIPAGIPTRTTTAILQTTYGISRAVVDRRPRRLHSRRIHWTVAGLIIMVGSPAPRSTMKYGGI